MIQKRQTKLRKLSVADPHLAVLVGFELKALLIIKTSLLLQYLDNGSRGGTWQKEMGPFCERYWWSQSNEWTDQYTFNYIRPYNAPKIVWVPKWIRTYMIYRLVM